jgi:acyl-CoA thioester hydrolase
MWHETEIRVRYAETDKMGIVHHSNHYVWFELGRSEYCRSKGFSYREMEDQADALLVVAESSCRYKSPAFYEDVLTIRTRVSRIRSRSISFSYQIYRVADSVVIAEGETLHIVTDKNNKIITMPEKYQEMLKTSAENKDV